MAHDNLDILERIIKLESKLAATAEKLDSLVDSIDHKYTTLSAKFDGDHNTPSIHSRVLQLESVIRSVKWGIGVLYGAVITMIIELILHKLKG